MIRLGLRLASLAVSPFPPYQSIPRSDASRLRGFCVRIVREQAHSRPERKSPTHCVRERGFLDAEGVGFEPTIPVKVCRFSRPVRSTRLRHPSNSGRSFRADGRQNYVHCRLFQKEDRFKQGSACQRCAFGPGKKYSSMLSWCARQEPQACPSCHSLATKNAPCFSSMARKRLPSVVIGSS